jgi:hypothetical protein
MTNEVRVARIREWPILGVHPEERKKRENGTVEELPGIRDQKIAENEIAEKLVTRTERIVMQEKVKFE